MRREGVGGIWRGSYGELRGVVREVENRLKMMLYEE